MGNGIFRKDSLDRIASPEQLIDYIRVTNPSVWVVLGAIAALLAAVLVWGAFGTLEDTLRLSALGEGGAAVCYVDEDAVQKLVRGMPAQVGEVHGVIEEVAALPVSAETLRAVLQDEYAFSRLTAGEWNYEVRIRAEGLSDGLFQARITLQSVHPIAFLWN